MGIQIDLDKCAGCGTCAPTCPFGLIEIIGDKAHINEGCNLCGACQQACAYEAILIETAMETAAGDSHRGVWVFAEQRDGKLKNIAYELLAKGRELADTLNTELAAICLGHNINDMETPPWPTTRKTSIRPSLPASSESTSRR
ncbi:MAG: electron transfer flavoprotein subunit alpha [Dehalococcoidales bacterium]|nr:electron transfer flavoprotein subunit alpha [Dehalococcoidales bacterium]